VDELIDMQLGAHDAVCGLVAEPIGAVSGVVLRVATVHGVDLLYEALKLSGMLNEAHLKAAVLHCMLDCADQRMKKWDGTYLWRRWPVGMLSICVERLMKNWEVLYNRYFMFAYPFNTPRRIEELAELARALLKNVEALERCILNCVVPDAEGEGAPTFGPKLVNELLDCVRQKLGKKAVYCVNWQILPSASAATKIFAELKKGNAVAVGFAEGYGCEPPFVETRSLEEFVEKLWSRCRQ